MKETEKKNILKILFCSDLLISFEHLCKRKHIYYVDVLKYFENINLAH